MNGAFVVAEDTPLIETLRRIDQGNLQLAVVERDGKIVGTVTDGDVRRALLSGVGLDASVDQVMNRTPIVAPVGISNGAALALMRRHSIHQLPIVDKPILETILTGFIKAGFGKFFISINYKADMIRDYFGDGSAWGVEISYLEERERLGTAGALSLLPSRPTQPFF